MCVVNDERYAALVSKVSRRVERVGQVGALDIGLICTLKRASSLMEDLIKTKGDAFEYCVLDEFGNSRLESNAPGNILCKLIKMHIPRDNNFSMLYKFEPYVDLAVNQIAAAGLYQVSLMLGVDLHGSHATALLQPLNECVDKIRQEANSKQFQSRLNNYRRASNKNYKELTGYVNALFERYSRLLVLRVDLSYQKQHSKTTQAEAKRDRERLFGNMRSNKLFGDMVGYIWKLEHGPEKGFHYHVMFFFDGSRVREDGVLAKRIGLYWVDVVTKGRGLYYNCNAVKFLYKSCGIGMVDHSDAQLREGLRMAMVYLTKTDLYMKLQTLGRGMGKGGWPDPKSSRGRPRATAIDA